MWSQQGFWPGMEPSVPAVAQESYRPGYPSGPWYPGYGQEQEQYYKPYPGLEPMGQAYSRSPPSTSPLRPLPSSTLKEFLTPPQGERDSREELTPPDSDGDREDKPFQCGYPKCSYETNRRNNLKRHMMTMHERLNSPHVCCGITFYRKADMRAHTKEIHMEGYPCKWPGCGKGFVRKALLDRHVKIHTGEKPFVCPVCHYGTSHKSNLDRHVRIHFKPPIADGKCWPGGQYDIYPSMYMPRIDSDLPNLPDSTTDHAGTPRRQSSLFSPDKHAFSGMPFSPGPFDLANINPLQLSPEKVRRGGTREDLEAWWSQAGAALTPDTTPRGSSPNTSVEGGQAAGMLGMMPQSMKTAPLTPPTPSKRQITSISHGIADILSSSLVKEEDMVDMADDNINVDGDISEEDDDDSYVPKKMRLAKKH